MKIYIFIITVLIGLYLNAQSYSYQWIRQMGSYSDESGCCLKEDINKNVYLAGTFSYTTDFIDTTLTSYGSSDGFLAKYDSLGHLIWIEQFGGEDSDEGTLIDFDNSGNVILAGFFHSDTAYVGDTALYSCGCSDFTFIAKFTENGDFVWAREIIGDGSVQIEGLVTTPGDSIVAAGYFYHSAIFDQGTIYPNGITDIFLVKYDGNGNEAWVKQFGGNNQDKAYDIVVSPDHYLYICGSFANKAVYGSSLIISRGLYDTFLAKIDPDGNALWAISDGGPGNDEAYALDMDSDQNLVLTGYGGDSLLFNGSYYQSNGDPDMILMKYDSAGVSLWCRMYGGGFDDLGKDIRCNPDNHIFVIGQFMNNIMIDTILLSTNMYSDILYTEFLPAGNCLWAKQIHSDKNDEGCSILPSVNALYLTGSFRDTADFNANTLYSYGGSDIFIARLIDDGFVYADNKHDTDIFAVYPNPTDKYLNISESNNDYLYQIYDGKGNLVIHTRERIIDMSLLQKGIYFLIIRKDAELIESMKVIRL